MKIPNNQNIIQFFLKYGLLVIIGLIVLFFVVNAISDAIYLASGKCVITENGQEVMVNGKVYEIKEIQKWFSGDLKIELKKK